MRRVAITGLGVCSPIGSTIPQFWTNLISGVCGVRKLSDDFDFISSRIAAILTEQELGDAKEAMTAYINTSLASRLPIPWQALSRASTLGLIAATQAMRQAGWYPLPSSEIDRNRELAEASNRACVYFGSGIDGACEIVEAQKHIEQRSMRGFGPYNLTRTLANMPASVISLVFGLRGGCMAPTTACATGLHAIGEAYRMSDGLHLVAPDERGEGLYRCMKAAIKDCADGVGIDDIGHINCHATSTPRGDLAELVAISRLVGSREIGPRSNDLPPILLNSIKGHTGHSLGGAGAIETVATCLSLLNGIVPGTINLDSPITQDEVGELMERGRLPLDDRDDLSPAQCVGNYARHLHLLSHNSHLNRGCQWSSRLLDRKGRRIALTNASGFGGTNGSLVLAEWRD